MSRALSHFNSNPNWNGYDLRHHLRVLRNLGIGIDREWEKHEGGQHGRWKLRAGHSYHVIERPNKTKPSAAPTVKASNLISNKQFSEVLNNG